MAIAQQQHQNPRNANLRKTKKQHLVLTKGKLPSKKQPKKAELVFLQMSPNYCERDLASGSLGTVGRSCNITSRGKKNCQMSKLLLQWCQPGKFQVPKVATWCAAAEATTPISTSKTLSAGVSFTGVVLYSATRAVKLPRSTRASNFYRQKWQFICVF